MTLRKTVLIVALLNLIWFFVQMGIALSINSVALLADGVDYLEDVAVNLLIFIALGWSTLARARMGKAMAFIILIPAAFAAWKAFEKFNDPVSPDALIMILAGLGALVINGICAYLLVAFKNESGSMTKAAWLAARNDLIANLAIVVVGIVTMWVGNGWPDIVAGLLILLINLGAAKEVWEAATEETDELIESLGDDD